jgi:hypothetical protein
MGAELYQVCQEFSLRRSEDLNWSTIDRYLQLSRKHTAELRQTTSKIFLMEIRSDLLRRNPVEGGYQMSQKGKIIILVAIGIICLAIILKAHLVSKAMAFFAPISTFTKISTDPFTIPTKAPIDPYIDEIEAYQQELNRTDLTPEERNLIETKLGTIAMMATQRAEGKINPPTRLVTPQETPTFEVLGEKFPDGIDNNPPILVPENVVTVLSSWRKTTSDGYFLIYSGYLTQDPEQGAILLLPPTRYSFTQFNTPSRSGSVRILAENGTTITLESAGGILYYFDATTEQFIDPKGTPVPTNTPGEE